ncbi:hypothetical protein V1634_27450 [Plantactinospora veratri]|uniref:Uncharacterized protein n=1 Tax=Plantactinospora veratri TaxID=1436122 RepID=A0ABU7SFU2_9ACTN
MTGRFDAAGRRVELCECGIRHLVGAADFATALGVLGLATH